VQIGRQIRYSVSVLSQHRSASVRGEKVLFLHGGPGMSAELERRQYGASLPVRWWDQPRIPCGTERPYEALIQAAVDAAVQLSDEREDAIDLLASSFGAYLARALVERIPERIDSVTICGGVWDLTTAIHRLARRFVERHGDPDLETACREAAQADGPECQLALLARVAAIPGFLDCYWSPTAQGPKEAMQRLAAQGRLIDWPTLHSVMTAALRSPQAPLRAAHRAEVRIVLGRCDPYFHPSDIEAWTTLWPAARVMMVEAGHFPHLELPPSVWLPA
jgi:pimeloyl-ACP methyl ester carboxylesterase